MSIAVKTDTGWQVLGVGESNASTKWGDWTIVDAPDEADTWTAPDSQGRIWKYVAFNTAGDYTINLTGGMYWVLAVGGGADAETLSEQATKQGQPGLVREGFWEFSANEFAPIKVGRAGTYVMQSTGIYPESSSVVDFSTQGIVAFGSAATGRGAASSGDKTGYKSFITGTETFYAQGNGKSPLRPGDAGHDGPSFYGPAAQPGCVIIATVDEDKTDYYPPGALPGVGGWATITSVWDGSGTKPNRYTYGDWVAFEWTDDGELTTQAGGLVDALLVGQGGLQNDTGAGAGGGGVAAAVLQVAPTTSVSIETRTGVPPGSWAKFGGQSRLGAFAVSGGGPGLYSANQSGTGYSPADSGSPGGGAGGRSTSSQPGPGVKSSITGKEIEYGRGGWHATPSTNNPGEGGGGSTASNVWGNPGVVIVRVPAAQAAGVPASEYVDVP